MPTYYALIGSWHFRPSPRGYAVFRYEPGDASLELVERGFEDVSAGAQALDEEKAIAYVCDERGSRRNELGGGGYVLAIRIDTKTGKMSLINEKPSLSPEPSYICLDKSGRYALVVHHCDGGYVTHIRKEDGKYRSGVRFDDAAVVLFPLLKDGSLGDPCDVAVLHGDRVPGDHSQAKLHAIVADPAGELFLVCDKGMDKIYSFGLDREKGKLVYLGEHRSKDGYRPRYGAFHPTLPVFYYDNEKAPVVCAVGYEAASGNLTDLAEEGIQTEANRGKPSEASDIAVHPSGRWLYVSDRGSQMIAMLALDEKGIPSLRQNVGCEGENPRGICLSPDGRFLLSANSDTNNISVFSVGEDGLLTLVRSDVFSPCPANIKIMRVRQEEKTCLS